MVKRRKRKKTFGKPLFLSVVAIGAILIILIFVFEKKDKPTVEKAMFPKIAIVLDDWGYTDKNLNLLSQIDSPLTLAVLPNLRYSQDVSLLSENEDREVILHLPMEPFSSDSIGLEPDTITCDMSSNKIRQILLLDIKSVSGARGVSNHMGSKATQDKRVMRIIMKELKRRKLYFLDSFVTDKTVVEESAKALGAVCAKRDVFLDNEKNSSYIINQLIELARIAKEYGNAIGIGHESSVTLRVLKDYIPKLKEEGFEFVLLSDLLK